MASVNKLSLYIGIPLLVLVYLGYVTLSNLNYDIQGRDLALQTHLKNVKEQTDIKGVILGGSNSVFGLSAEVLSESLGVHFYNASFVNEGFSPANYHAFVDGLFSKTAAEKVDVVFFSTIKFLQQNWNETTVRNFFGRAYASNFIPDQALGVFLLKQHPPWFPKNIKYYGNITQFGDFNFTNYPCDFTPPTSDEFDHLESSEIMEFMDKEYKFLAHKFPNAKVFFVPPVEFDQSPLKRQSFLHSLEDEFAKHKLNYIHQASVADLDLICDVRHHLNEKGRIYRTKDLAQKYLEFAK